MAPPAVFQLPVLLKGFLKRRQGLAHSCSKLSFEKRGGWGVGWLEREFLIISGQLAGKDWTIM